jgi:hypothetical protein
LESRQQLFHTPIDLIHKERSVAYNAHMKTRKSWREKMDNPDLPKFVAMLPNMRARFGSGTMLVPSPREVDACIRKVPRGSVTTGPNSRVFGGQVSGRCHLSFDHWYLCADRGGGRQ